MTALGMGATFAVFTFLSPLLTHVTGFDSKGISLVLMVFVLGRVRLRDSSHHAGERRQRGSADRAAGGRYGSGIEHRRV
ncbi:MAG: hypothetical protein CPDRYMAC_4849 [uncultured Paraburkholderia sp.]|nr:MAG: hypothetical protein CPDRYDRY_4806 [uncultured Paraburkholderia sp.]CAH2938554.1 MAG: hypothetical protein CPDRYMAC_4849 [uncultured Paraburkholderia sp.]